MSLFRSSKKYQKGIIGEAAVQSVLEKKGYIVYKAVTDGAHGFDFLAVKDKQVFVIAEVKAKARMNKFKATGINISHFEDYMRIWKAYNIDVILFFVDEHPEEQRIYCQKLSELIRPRRIDGVDYPNTKIASGIVLFSLSLMIHVDYLNISQLEELRNNSTRSYGYE